MAASKACPLCRAPTSLRVAQLDSGAEVRVCRSCSRSWLRTPTGITTQRIPPDVIDQARKASTSIGALVQLARAELAHRSSACRRMDCPRPIDGGDRAERALDGLRDSHCTGAADAIAEGDLEGLLLAAIELDDAGLAAGDARTCGAAGALRRIHSRLSARVRPGAS